MLESGDGLLGAGALVGWKATSKPAIRANKMQVLGARKKERAHREGGARREREEVPKDYSARACFAHAQVVKNIDVDLRNII